MIFPKISVVIGAYNQLDPLTKVLNSFRFQNLSKEEFEVVLVDSSSTDGTADFLKSFDAGYTFRYIIQENLGKVGARNRGVQEARGQYIFITDADMIAHKELLSQHVLAQERSLEPSCFEGLTYNMTSLKWPADPETLSPYIERKYRSGAALGWYYFLTGNISFPKSLFESENGFSSDFQGYGWEDLELGYRLSKRKIPLYYLKEAINYHYHVISEADEIRRNYHKGLSARIFLKKHPELKWFLGLNPLSRFLFPRIKEKGRFYSFVQSECYQSSHAWKHAFGAWFLKEYNYMKGILSTKR